MNQARVRYFRPLIALSLLTLFGLLAFFGPTGCGDGSDGGSGTIRGSVFDSTLALGLVAKDGSGDPIANLQVCGLGSCDTTDANGAYNVSFDSENFGGGQVLFTFVGGDINSTGIVVIPAGSTDLIINFGQNSDGTFTGLISFTEATPTSAPEPTVGPQGTVTSEPTPTSAPIDPTAEPTPTVFFGTPSGESGCEALSGSYTGDQGCGIGSVSASGSLGSVVLTPFGENSSAAFSVDGTSASSVSQNLIILGFTGHSCNLSCASNGESFTVSCRSSRGTCSESFR